MHARYNWGVNEQYAIPLFYESRVRALDFKDGRTAVQSREVLEKLHRRK